MTLPTTHGAARTDEILGLVPAGLLMLLWMVWIGSSGGYAPELWYPSALGAESLAVVVLILGGRWLPASRVQRVALLGFAAVVALDYLSMLWSASAGSALDASNKLALYAVTAWIFAVLPWSRRTLTALLLVWSFGIGAFCALGLLEATSAANLNSFFVEQRWAVPLEYSNATAALGVIGMWPALILSVRRELPPWLRALCLALAVFLGEFAVLPQSRGALLGLVVTAPVALAASSDRLRLIWRMAVVGGGLAACLPRVVAVDNAANAGRLVAPVLTRATDVMLITSLAALVLGAGAALVEDRLAARPALRRHVVARLRRAIVALRSNRAARAALLASAVVILGIAAVAAAAPVEHAVRSVIKNGKTDAGVGSNRLLSTAPEERLDYARVALDVFAQAPILGVGAGNFGRRYDALRRFPKHSQYTHNLTLRVLSETGIVGLVVFLVTLAALSLGLIRAAGQPDGLGRAGAAAALTVAAYFLVHASLDWLDQFPALAAPALAFPMAAMAQHCATQPVGPSGQADRATAAGNRIRRVRQARMTRPIGGVLAGVAAVALCVALAGPYLATRYSDRAFATFRARPQAAFHDLSVAQKLDPVSADPITSEGSIALYLGRDTRARKAFARSLRREDDWYPRLELALLDARSGDFASASREIEAAAALDADDPLIVQARSEITRRQRIDPVGFDQSFLRGSAQAAVSATSTIP